MRRLASLDVLGRHVLVSASNLSWPDDEVRHLALARQLLKFAVRDRLDVIGDQHEPVILRMTHVRIDAGLRERVATLGGVEDRRWSFRGRHVRRGRGA